MAGLVAEVFAVALLATHFLTGYTFLNPDFIWPQLTGQEEAIEAVLAQIPADASLSAEMHLSTHLAQRETLRIFPDLRDAEWVVINAWFGGDPYGSLTPIWRELSIDPAWETVTARDGLLLLRQGNGPPSGIEEAFRASDLLRLQPVDVQFGASSAGLRLLGFALHPLPEGNFVFCSRWETAGHSQLVPQLAVAAEATGSLNWQWLDSLRFVPQIFSEPGIVQDCTAIFSERVGTELILALSGIDSKDRFYQPMILEAGASEGVVEILEEYLVIRP